MRDLTEEELKLAPKGFDEYGFNRSGQVFFFNRELGCAVIDGINEVLNLSHSHYAFDECKPINRKPFDITQHEWSDNDIRIFPAPIVDDDLTLEANCIKEYVILERKDAIAIANHFKLTAEDLK